MQHRGGASRRRCRWIQASQLRARPHSRRPRDRWCATRVANVFLIRSRGSSFVPVPGTCDCRSQSPRTTPTDFFNPRAVTHTCPGSQRNQCSVIHATRAAAGVQAVDVRAESATRRPPQFLRPRRRCTRHVHLQGAAASTWARGASTLPRQLFCALVHASARARIVPP